MIENFDTSKCNIYTLDNRTGCNFGFNNYQNYQGHLGANTFCNESVPKPGFPFYLSQQYMAVRTACNQGRYYKCMDLNKDDEYCSTQLGDSNSIAWQ